MVEFFILAKDTTFPFIALGLVDVIEVLANVRFSALIFIFETNAIFDYDYNLAFPILRQNWSNCTSPPLGGLCSSSPAFYPLPRIFAASCLRERVDTNCSPNFSDEN